MNPRFGQVLQGLLDNRRLSPSVVSRVTGLPQSSINRVLHREVEPTPELLEDLAPVLRMSVADLRAIACVTDQPSGFRPSRFPASSEMGALISLCSFMTPEEAATVVEFARTVHATHAADQPPSDDA